MTRSKWFWISTILLIVSVTASGFFFFLPNKTVTLTAHDIGEINSVYDQLPIDGSAELRTVRAIGRTLAYEFVVVGTPEDIFQRFKHELEARGWEYHYMPEPAFHTFTKAGGHIYIALQFPKDQRMKLVLSYFASPF